MQSPEGEGGTSILGHNTGCAPFGVSFFSVKIP